MHNKKHEFSLLDNITFELNYTVKLLLNAAKSRNLKSFLDRKKVE